MKVKDLFEGQLRRGRYDIGNFPSARHRELAHLYNNVIPALSRIFKIPTTNFKVQSDYGNDFLDHGRYKEPYSTEKALMAVILRRADLDADLITKMLPKALKNELQKQLVDVEVKDVKLVPAKEDVYGRRVPPRIVLRFSAKPPQQWRQWDKERYS